jgi:hypothetical protein
MKISRRCFASFANLFSSLVSFRRCLVLTACNFVISFSAIAAPYERVPVTTVKPLLLAALSNGEAHGVLVGDIAQAFRTKFQSSSPINVDVRVMQSSRDCNLADARQSQICRLLVDHAVAHPGCQRLIVSTTQSGIVIPLDSKQPSAQQSSDQRLTYQVNLCTDGRLLEPVNHSSSVR